MSRAAWRAPRTVALPLLFLASFLGLPTGANAQAPDPALLEAIDCYTGVAGRVDDDRARTLLLSLAEGGDVLARMWISRAYSRGRMGFPRDEVRAGVIADSVVVGVRSLAGNGSVEATFLMGTVFDEALGADEDAHEAARWYRRAAEAGHVLGQHNLGNAYRAGRGVAADDAEAVFWWRQAAEAGDAIAELRMGEMCEAGLADTSDPGAARAWYRRAAARGNTAAAAALIRLGGPAYSERNTPMGSVRDARNAGR